MNILASWLKNLRRKNEDEEADAYEPSAPAPAADPVSELLTDCENCILTPIPRVTLTVMTVADMHGKLMQRSIEDKLCSAALPDAVFLLGDNFSSDIGAVLAVIPESIPVFGVSGNHDFEGNLRQYPRIADVSGKCTLPHGSLKDSDFTIAGLSGSIRYKDEPRYCMLTNEESDSIMSGLPRADILLTHDKPCFAVPSELTSHSGLTGIGKYILEKKPSVVLHGHLHERHIKRLGGTVIRCCYGVEVFEIAF